MTAEQWNAVVEAAGGWPEDDLESFVFDVEKVQQISAEESGSNIGQGFTSNPERRRAVEQHAMRLATEHLKTQHWQVVDVSSRASFDLYCTKPTGEELRVEVKGTTSDGCQVWLTANEVKHARTHYPNVALVIVARVEVTTNEGHAPRATGGELLIFEPWEIDSGCLVPITYSYRPVAS